jgi:protocatechuate 3,4-dioxygenase beta subunit
MTTDRHSPSHRPLTRREALAASAVAGTGVGLAVLLRGVPARALAATGTTAAAAPSCVLTPEQTEGPYYIDGALVRRTITERKAGVALDLRLTVVDSSTCSPIAGATVEIWHADALGVYSGFGAGASSRTFLRGAQRSDAHGLVEFKTLYPGWYRGRTPHIHVKVHVGGQTVHTGQLYFRDATTRRVYERAPYRSHGEPDTTNAADNIYGAGGSKSLLALRRRGRGYVGRLTMGVRT